MTVLGITPEDAVDNFAVLAALAGKAAEWATARITPPRAGRAARTGRSDRRRRRRRRRQLALPPRPQPGGSVAPPADLPPPGGAGRAGKLLRASSPSRSAGAGPTMPCSLKPSTEAMPSRPGRSPSPMSSTPELPWVTGCERGRPRWNSAAAAPEQPIGRVAQVPAAATARRARERKPSSFSSGVRTRVLRDMIDTSWPAGPTAEGAHRGVLLGDVGERVERVPAHGVLVGHLADLVVGDGVAWRTPAPSSSGRRRPHRVAVRVVGLPARCCRCRCGRAARRRPGR